MKLFALLNSLTDRPLPTSMVCMSGMAVKFIEVKDVILSVMAQLTVVGSFILMCCGIYKLITQKVIPWIRHQKRIRTEKFEVDDEDSYL